MGFRDLAEVAGVREPKVLPILGEDVAFPGTVSAEIGARMMLIYRAGQAVMASPETAEAEIEAITANGLTQASVDEMEAALLGDGAEALDRLQVWGAARNRVISTLTVWHIVGQEAAEAVWEGKAPTGAGPAPANRAARRATGGRSSVASGKATKAPTRSKAQTRTTTGGGSSAKAKGTRAQAGS